MADGLIEVQMPEMGESVTEGTILEWHVSEGEEVAEGDTIVEVSTDKIDAEVPGAGERRDHQDPRRSPTTRSRSARCSPRSTRTAARRQRRRARRPLKEPTATRDGGGEGDADLGDDAVADASSGPTRRASPRPTTDPAAPDATRRRRAKRLTVRDARDGRVGDRGHGPRVARRRGRHGRRGRHRGRGLDRQGRRRGPGPGRRHDHEASGRSPTRRSRSARRWPR